MIEDGQIATIQSNNNPMKATMKLFGKSDLFSWVAFIIAILSILPIVGVIWNASTLSSDVWGHLIQYVLPNAATTTLVLLLGIAVFVFLIGTVTAWLVSRYNFFGKKIFEWALVLPLAIPTYIAAYVYVEFLDYSGPMQEGVRFLFGFESIKDYWFPDIRTTGGAIFLLSAVLYPYVYLPARLSFYMQNTNILDVGRVLGANAFNLFTRIAVPAARPAIAIGILLALMEALNDIGAVEYLGVRTLTLSIYDTWLNRSSLAGSSQLAIFLLIIIVLMILLEKHFRRNKNYQDQKTNSAASEPVKLTGAKSILAMIVCFLPILFGFLIPVGQILSMALVNTNAANDPSFHLAISNSLLVAIITALLCVFFAFVVVYFHRRAMSRSSQTLRTLSSFGYAVPGTILALGILSIFSPLDNWLDRVFTNSFGIKTGLLITGGMGVLVYAYSVRFLTIAIGTIESGYDKISVNLANASRALGRTEFQTLVQIDIPLLKGTFLTAILLVLVETIKELSATLLLRPFNFDTLATYVYDRASRALFEEAALAALAIVIMGLIPVYLLIKVIVSKHNKINS